MPGSGQQNEQTVRRRQQRTVHVRPLRIGSSPLFCTNAGREVETGPVALSSGDVQLLDFAWWRAQIGRRELCLGSLAAQSCFILGNLASEALNVCSLR